MNLPTKVSGEPIEDFAVLKEGVHYGPHNGWGWKHIWEEELRTKRFYNFYKGKYSGEALKQKILEDIEKTLRYGSRTVDTEGEVIIYEYDGIKVFVSIKKENVGSIQTARPALHG